MATPWIRGHPTSLVDLVDRDATSPRRGKRPTMRSPVALLAFLCCVDALLLAPHKGVAPTRAKTVMEFGSGFGSYYSGWDDWVKEYPQVDKDAYPALFWRRSPSRARDAGRRRRRRR
eukprot:5396297-Prymnesium_polylepis.2